ncbi:P-loop NTPase, partial [Klebsiella pneumoniae]|uniref:P-loop NTPase n=1 Tax=Klebsiella pneumoniae TaxID=573 RepID=UPI000ADF18F4
GQKAGGDDHQVGQEDKQHQPTDDSGDHHILEFTIALIDAKKGIVMFEKVEVPVLGIVENMSMHICSNCGHHEPIFGTGGAQKLAEKYHTQLLGQLPLHITLREDLDNGTPTVVARSDSEFTDIYRQLAGRVAAQMYWQGEVIPGEIAFRAV